MALPDYTTTIRRRAKGRQIEVRMYDLPRPHLAPQLRLRRKVFARCSHGTEGYSHTLQFECFAP